MVLIYMLNARTINKRRNTMKVKILRLGDAATEVDVPRGSSVAAVIKKAGYEDQGYTRTLNGQVVFDSTPVKDGDVVTLAPKVEGGAATMSE